MSHCPSCAADVTPGDRTCAACGFTPEDESNSPTGTAPRPAGPLVPTPSPNARTPSSGSGRGAVAERFAPGTVLASRYRIVGLIGRGGMGEVYRADDLKLEQPVALKFLPYGLDADADRLARFYREVRVSRQVSHPAVCRVYDIAEADGHLFLSMELVDGENLASLLRRIGRLPGDKATDIARQLCAGLAAAHEKGVLHRDLKPANVMLDGQGNVRITDFGLAALAASLQPDDVRSGTPSYMSPEQLGGREVTQRSDIYGLGLVLYELFTGRRAFQGRGIAELSRKHREERPIDPSSLVPGLDVHIERAILACLEKDPHRRPASALVVSAMLTGSDPLEAAIAAGETPSPELVAAAGETERLRPAFAWALLALVLVGLALAPLAARTYQLLATVPVGKPPAVLEDRAREFLARAGVTTPAVDDAWGLMLDWGYLTHIREQVRSTDRWSELARGTPPALQFWYRRSPRPLVSLYHTSRVYWMKPFPDSTGMAGVVYDTNGRLLRYYAVSPQLEQDAPQTVPEPSWSMLFAEAQLSPQDLRPVPPRWTPAFHTDTRAAWEGHWPQRPDLPIRVEAAAYRGRPVWFEVVLPWTRPERMEGYAWPAGKVVRQAAFLCLTLVLIGAGVAMARRNVASGRGDRRGAFRIAVLLLALGLVSWILGAHHVADWNAQRGLAFRGAGYVVLQAAFVWLFYLAVEPYARRLRPWTLVSWTRLMAGGVRDPVVGRDTLVGLAWAVLFSYSMPLAHLAPQWLGMPAPQPMASNLEALEGAASLVSMLAVSGSAAMLFGTGALLLFVLLRMLLRNDWLAAAAIAAGMLVPDAFGPGETSWLAAPIVIAAVAAWIALLLRFGLLAAIVGIYANGLLEGFPLTSELGTWMAGPTVLVLALVGVTALLAFRSSLGGTGLRRALAEEASSRG